MSNDSNNKYNEMNIVENLHVYYENYLTNAENFEVKNIKFNLKDYINIEDFQKLMEARYEATGIPIGIADANNDFFIAVGWQKICLDFHRKNIKSCANCIESDNYIKNNLVNEGFIEYKCKNGLWDIAAPIIVEGEHIATLFMGQYFYNDEVIDREYFINQAKKYGYDIEKYLETLDAIPRFSKENIRKIMNYNILLVKMIVNQAIQTHKFNIERELYKYKDLYYNNIFNSIKDAVFIHDLNTGEILDVNNVMLEMFGIKDKKDIKNISLNDISAVDEGYSLEKAIEKLKFAEELGETTFEWRSKRLDGTKFWSEVKLSFTTMGNKKRIIAVVRDITERKNSEKFLEKVQKEWSDIFQAIGQPAMILDTDHNILSFNKATLDIFNVSPENLIGKKCYELYQPDLTLDEIKKCCPLEKLLKSKKFEIFEMEIKTLQKSFLVSCTPILDENGNIEKIIHIATDITERKRNEELLKSSEEKFRAFFELPITGNAIVSLDGKWIFVNDKLCQIFGYDRDELTKISWRDLTPKEDLEEEIKRYDKWIAERKSNAILEKKYVRKDGKIINAVLSVAPIYKNGNVEYFLVTIEDITEKKEAEEILKNNERKFRAIFNQSYYFAAVLSPEGVILDINKIALDFKGITFESVIGKYFWESPWWTHDIKLQDKVYKTIKSIPFSEEPIRYEVTHYDKNDNLRIIDFSLRTVRDDLNKILFLVAEGNDITERKRIEQEIKQKSRELERYFNKSLDLLCITDSKGYFIKLNPEWEKTLGYSLSEMIGKDVLNFVHPDDQKSTIDASNKLYSKNELTNFINRMRCKNGEYKWIEWRAFFDDGFIYAVARDITDRKKYEDALRKSEEYFRSLFENMVEGVVLHEFIFNEKNEPIDYKIINVNPRYEQILGLSKSDVLGKLATEAYKTKNPPYLSEYFEVVKTKKPYQFEAYFEPLDKYLDISVVPWGENGFASIFYDITDKKNAENNLKINEERLRLVLEATSDGIWDWDRTSNNIYLSARSKELFNLSIENNIINFENFIEIINKKGKNFLIDNILRQLDANKSFSLEFSFMDKNFNLKWILCRGKAVEFDKKGNMTRVVGTFTDLTERKITEKALQKSEEKFKIYFENAPDGILIFSKSGICLNANSSIKRILGLKTGEIINKNIFDIFSLNNSQIKLNLFDDLKESNKTSHEILFKKKDNSTVYLLFESSKLPDGNYISYCKDITEQKLAIDALYKSEERYRFITENIVDIVWTFDISQMDFTYISPSINKLTNNYQSISKMKVMEPCFKIIENKLKENKWKNIDNIFIDEAEYILDNGETIIAEIKMNFIFDQNNKPSTVLGVIRDITEKRKQREEITKSREQYRALVENHTDIIMRIDKNHRFLFANKAIKNILLVNPEDIKGKKFIDIGFSKGLSELLENALEKIIKLKDLIELEFELESDKGYFIINLSLIPEFDKYGEVETILGVARDITKIKQNENNLRKAISERDILLHEIHHRVKNNLNNVIGLLSLQSAISAKDDIVKSSLMTARNRIYSMAIVHELLYKTNDWERINLKTYISRLVEHLASSNRSFKTNVKIECKIEDINIDMNRSISCGLLINEIISNSYKHAFNNRIEGKIFINLSKEDSKIKLIIGDDGDIPKDFKLSSGKTLGTELITNLVKQLNGELTYYCDNGLTYEIYFPENI